MSLTDADRAVFDAPDFTPEDAAAEVIRLRREVSDEAAANYVLQLCAYAAEWGGSSRDSFRRGGLARCAQQAMRAGLS